MGKEACVVKILGTSATSFAAVNYNEAKVRQGEAKCVAMENFGLLEKYKFRDSETVIKYLEKIADKNDKVEHPQLHFTISYPGKATDQDKLEIQQNAKDMLEELGYKDQPLLLYWHSDTDHDHLHGVSVRVNQKTGAWINNSFEGVNARRILDHLRGIEHDKQIDRMVKYNYTSHEQFQHVIHANGYHIARDEDEECYQIYRSSMKEAVSVTFGDIDEQIRKSLKKKKDERDDELARLKMIRGFLRDARKKSFNEEVHLSGKNNTKRGRTHTKTSNKAESRVTSFRGSDGIDLSEMKKAQFKKFLLDIKRRLGIEILFHRNEEGQVRGYTVVDNGKGLVFNGSEVMRLDALLGGKKMDTDFVLSPELAAEVSEEYQKEREEKRSANEQEPKKDDWAKDVTPDNVVARVMERLGSLGIPFNPDLEAMARGTGKSTINDIVDFAIECVNMAEKTNEGGGNEFRVRQYTEAAIMSAKLAEQIRYPNRKKGQYSERKPSPATSVKEHHKEKPAITKTLQPQKPKQEVSVAKNEETKKTSISENTPSNTDLQRERTSATNNAIKTLRQWISSSKGLFDAEQEHILRPGIVARSIDMGLDSFDRKNLVEAARDIADMAGEVGGRANLAVTRIVQLVGEMAMPQDVSVGGPGSNNDLTNKKDDDWDLWKKHGFGGMRPTGRKRHR